MTSKRLEEILNIEITIEPIKKCWLVKNRDWSIYTTIKKRVAHRLVYELCNGPLIPGRMICHKCDRPGCINPSHLFQGTASDNLHDSQDKGRWRFHHSHLTITKKVKEEIERQKKRNLELQLPKEYWENTYADRYRRR